MRYHLPMTARRWAVTVTLLGFALVDVSGAAAQVELPFEFELPLSPVEVELHDSLLEVTIEPGAEPMVQARRVEGAVGEPATFAVGQGGGRTRITRTPTPEGLDPARAIVTLTLDPGQNLHVIGRDIMLVVNGPGGGYAADDVPPTLPGKGATEVAGIAHSYELFDSEADLTGFPAATIVAENTAVHCDGGSGELAAQLSWSGLTVTNHDGGIRIASLDSETTLEGVSGAVEFELQGGGLRLQDGAGSVQGTCDAGFVGSNGWDGTFSLGGSDASFELRDGSVGQLKITSSNTVTTIDEIRGSVIIEATGGQITMDSVQGNLTATVSEGGQVVSDVVYGTLTLNLKNDAYGEVNRSSGAVKANIDSAELRVEGAKSLDLNSENSRATVEGIKQLAGFDARYSEVELDLREASDRKLTLHVGEGTTVDLSLTSPCNVQLRESTPGGSGVNVTGCALQLERAGRWRRGRISANDGRRPFFLIAKVADTGSLRVHGGS